MCLIVTILLGAFAFNFFAAGDVAMGLFAALGSVGFLAFMIRNILQTKKERGKADISCLNCQSKGVKTDDS